MSSAPIRTAATDTASSGSDVAPATNSVPTNEPCQPVPSTIRAATKGSQKPPATTATAAAAPRLTARTSVHAAG
jgi:hypothetical protein